MTPTSKRTPAVLGILADAFIAVLLIALIVAIGAAFGRNIPSALEMLVVVTIAALVVRWRAGRRSR